MNVERRRLLATAVLLPVASARAASGEFPDKPVRLVVPFPPGGGADNLARAIMPKVSQALGRPIIIDNKPARAASRRRDRRRRGADRLHAADGTNGTDSINQSLTGTCVRSDPGLHAGVADNRDRGDAGRERQPPVMTTTQLIRYARRTPARSNFRIRRQRHDVAPVRRALQDR